MWGVRSDGGSDDIITQTRPSLARPKLRWHVSAALCSPCMVPNPAHRVSVAIVSPEISGTDLRVSIPPWRHVYAVPFLPFYPLLAYAYYVKYDQWLRSEEWTFLACVMLGAGHALSFLVTRWSAKAKAWITTREVRAHPFCLRHNCR